MAPCQLVWQEPKFAGLKMDLQPVYSPNDVSSPACHLRHTWSGWPCLSTFPAVPSEEFFQELDARWENDGMRRLEMRWSAELIQITFSVKPQVSPGFFTSRVKGRLQHALRKRGYAISTRSVMPDHLHLALRGNIEQSPEEIALAMMNNLAYAFGQNPIWQSSYYAGTLGGYDMDAVRRNG